jgi:hypothetical protein
VGEASRAIKPIRTFALADAEGEPIREPVASARGSLMAVRSGRRVYRIDVRDLDTAPRG